MSRRHAGWVWAVAVASGLAGGIVAVSGAPAARAAADAPKRDAQKADAHKAEPDAKAATFEVYKDKAGEYRWRLRTVNKNVIATSGDGYKDKRDCLAGIESVRKHAAEAKVAEE